MNEVQNMKHTFLHLRRQRGKDKVFELSIGRSLVVLIVLVVLLLADFPIPGVRKWVVRLMGW